MTLRLLRYALFWSGIAVVGAGCGGDDPLDPDVTGLVNAMVHDTPAGAAVFTGTAAGNQHVSIRSTGGTWVDVGMPNGITVALQSTTPTTVHGSTSVPAGLYDRVRLTLSGVTFSIDAGGTVDGTVLSTDASAEVAGSADLLLELSVTPFTVSTSAGTASVSFDLNVENWIDVQSLNDGVIPNATVAGRLTAIVTSG